MPKSIRVRVLLFAILAEVAARREAVLELPPGSTVRQAVDELIEAYPRLKNSPIAHAFFAVNQEYVAEETVLRDGDELALIPPVSGGEAETTSSHDGRFAITTAPLDPESISELVRGPEMGAHCTFVGTVRGITGSRETTHLFYESYPAMAIAEMERIAADMRQRWPDTKVAMHHRIGRVSVGEAAVVIAVAAPHRDNAFPACRFGIDEVKRRCPIWKKEFYSDGTVEWGAPDAGPPQAVES